MVIYLMVIYYIFNIYLMVMIYLVVKIYLVVMIYLAVMFYKAIMIYLVVMVNFKFYTSIIHPIFWSKSIELKRPPVTVKRCPLKFRGRNGEITIRSVRKLRPNHGIKNFKLLHMTEIAEGPR